MIDFRLPEQGLGSMKFEPIDFSKLETYSLHARQSLVSRAALARPTDPPGDILAGMPEVLAASHLREICRETAAAAAGGRTVVLAMGAHVIKCALSLLVIDLMEKGIVSAVALNGAGAIHDWELAAAGGTSEDVQEGLKDGSFGMAAETAAAVNGAAMRAAGSDQGFGRVLGEAISGSDLPNRDASIVAAGARLDLPVTIHVSLGCDIVHMHPDADGAAIGAASMADFRILAGVVSTLEGGVWINVGSSVVLPEVFLKALAVSRNVRGEPQSFLTADFDMIRHYRPTKNVVERPSSRGLAVTGHHEILFPLFRWGVLNEIARLRKGDRS
jgi:hypothetical protein